MQTPDNPKPTTSGRFLDKESRHIVACHVLPAIVCFVSATVLLLTGVEHGWGWLMLFGFLWSIHGSNKRQVAKAECADAE